MTSRKLPATGIAATIDLIGEDLLHNIVSRLPATSFASAACVSRSWNLVCERLLSRPKLSSACSFNHSLQDAVEEVVNKVLSEPIRPHFAIASIGGYYEDDLGEAQRLINTKLGSQVPVIINRPYGIIGRDALSDDFKEIEWYCYYEEIDAIMLIVGFLPGMKVKIIPLLKQIREPEAVMIDEFVTGIREFSTSVSGCNSPAAILMSDGWYAHQDHVIEKLDYAMSQETVIVGNTSGESRYTNDAQFGTSSSVALVFAVDMNKPPGIGETQFHAVLSSGLSPVGTTYKVTSVIRECKYSSQIAAGREGSSENIDGETIWNQVYDAIEDKTQDLYIGLTKERKYSIGEENAGCMTSLAFRRVHWMSEGFFYVHGGGLKTGDTFRFYHSDTTTALSSAAAVSSHMRSFNQGSNITTRDKLEVFGGLIFTCPDIYGEPYISSSYINSSPFLDNFPGVTLGGTFCGSVIGRRVLTPYQESQQQKLAQCCVHIFCSVYLIMSYTPSNR